VRAGVSGVRRGVADTLVGMTVLPPLRYLTGADVTAAMPPLAERLALAELTLRGLAGGAELPPKIGVHPRPAASFAHAMPALLRGDAADGSADRLGMKWVSGNPANNAAGLLGIYGVLVLNDPVSTAPVAILDAGPITAERTAATSGVAIRAFAPRVPGDGVPRAALIGAGVQGRSHVPVLGHVLPGVTLSVFDRDRGRAGALADLARETPGIGGVRVAGSAREAVEGAGVVVTVASFVAPSERQVMTNDWLAPDVLVVPVDYATYCAAEVARDAALFAVDHTAQFLANREIGNFDGYPDPAAMIGEVLDRERPAGRVVTTHLGTGLADVVFGSAILAEAVSRGLGTILTR
jgi:ornithine cyclodeaminase/alanine dehydrogenase-like protein (mu-crystallin family)